MIKSIFVDEKYLDNSIDDLLKINFNHIFITLETINKNRWDKLIASKRVMAISIGAFQRGSCPLNPKSAERLERLINNSLLWKPDEIWLDHFRFDGNWETVQSATKRMGFSYPYTHNPCEWCKRKNRGWEILRLATWVRSVIPTDIKIGYFAVPFKLDDQTKLVKELGQDHEKLCQIFDIISPMLYHRMIKKPVSYISDYIKYLARLTNKSILPIIQIKDMPDASPDHLDWSEFKKSLRCATEKPASGVSIFYWAHAVETSKVKWIKKVFN